MKQLENYIENQEYTDQVHNAVRYGYLYRKEAEKYEDGSFHACLGSASDVLLWLANVILGGVIYDVLKKKVKGLYDSLIKKGIKLDKQVIAVLTEEMALEEFYEYILEFDEHRLKVSKKQFKYIKEEIIADYVGNATGNIYKKEKREPTIEENKVIIIEALSHADELIGTENNYSD